LIFSLMKYRIKMIFIFLWRWLKIAMRLNDTWIIFYVGNSY
jgi:hypothetical protein